MFQGRNVDADLSLSQVQGDLSEEVKTHQELAKESWSYKGKKFCQVSRTIYVKGHREGTFKDPGWRGQQGPDHKLLSMHTSGT